jgi:predicted transcriptional regulator
MNRLKQLPRKPTIVCLANMTKIYAVTLMLISFNVTTMFAQSQFLNREYVQNTQVPSKGKGQKPDHSTEDNSANILAALLEKLKRLEARQDELSKQVDNLQHRVDQLTAKP